MHSQAHVTPLTSTSSDMGLYVCRTYTALWHPPVDSAKTRSGVQVSVLAHTLSCSTHIDIMLRT